MSPGELEKLILTLVIRAEDLCLIAKEDRIYCFNRIICLFRKEDAAAGLAADTGAWRGLTSNMGIPQCLDKLCDIAAAGGLIDDLTDAREIFSSEIMNSFLDKPSIVNLTFQELYASDPAKATDWFYQFSQASNYIQSERIKRNIVYQADSSYGMLDITINLAKPEKNPRDIIAGRRQVHVSYPRCLLCIENEGYAGRLSYPARSAHRMIRLELSGEPWFFQYSPYSYYPEHCIVLAGEHRPMRIDKTTFGRLVEFAEKFPHYFIGSNADLPIVGGSILSHDHYQGGRYEFAMNRAAVEYDFDLPSFANIRFGLVRWPMSVIRLVSGDKKELVDAVDFIFRQWKQYSDPDAAILAESGGEPHNTVTPIVLRRGQEFVIDLVLRNNRTDSEHPLGIFHPHEDVHHIKKENIGLIEVMGLAVLPPRLAGELAEVELYLQGENSDVAPYHRQWAEALMRETGGASGAASAEKIVRQAVARKFERVLEDAGVFKRNPAGQSAFRKFASFLRQVLD